MVKINKSDIVLAGQEEPTEKIVSDDQIIVDVIEEQPKQKSKKSRKKKEEVAEEERLEVADDDETSKKRQRLIHQILKYQESKYFKKIVVDRMNLAYTYEKLNKWEMEDLQDLLNRIRTNIDQDALDKFYDTFIEGSSILIEKTITPFYDIDGFTDNLMTNEQFHIIMERYKIESELPQVPLGLQLSHCVLTTMITTHLINNRGVPVPSKELVLTAPSENVIEEERPQEEDATPDGKTKKKIRPDFI